MAMGRRWGKTFMAGSYAMECADDGAAVAWVVPTYKNARPTWRFAERLAGPVANQVRINRSERTIEFPSGGWLGVYTADNPVGILGDAFDIVIVEEAARIAADVWTETLMPTLADRDGYALLISTPRGLNWFYQEYQRALAAGAAFNAPSANNPNPNIRRAALLAKERVPSRTYRQEWLAEFVTDGAYFQNVDACCSVTAPDSPAQHAGHTIVAGLDWGLSNDYTVLTILCRECSRVVDWWRGTGSGYIEQRARVEALYRIWNVSQILPERNSMGQPNIEMLRASGLTVALGTDMDYGWFMTASNKPLLIERLALALERGELRAPAEYAGELRAFEVQTRAQGHTAYSAPDGGHDDCVVSLALAWYTAASGSQIWI